MIFPLKKYKCKIPIAGKDPGGFGTVRKFDIHTGIDLYCELNDEVFSIEDGEVIDIHKFTGDNESPWWEETNAVVVKGNSGFILYGEIKPIVKIGDLLKTGDLIGNVMRVLKKQKGENPTTMLHIELYSEYNGSVWWMLDEKKPRGLENPEKILKIENK